MTRLPVSPFSTAGGLTSSVLHVSALSSSLLPFIPNPDRSGLNSNKNFAPNSLPLVDHNFAFTLDHTLTPTQSLHYAQWRNSFIENVFNQAPIVPFSNILTSASSNPALGSVFLLNYINAVKPTLVATAGFSWIGEINNVVSLNPAPSAASCRTRSPTSFPA